MRLTVSDPFAASIAISTRIAWYIGAASGIRAEETATKSDHHLSICVGMTMGLLVCISKVVGTVVRNDAQVIDLASKVLIIGAAYQINDICVLQTAYRVREGKRSAGI